MNNKINNAVERMAEKIHEQILPKCQETECLTKIDIQNIISKELTEIFSNNQIINLDHLEKLNKNRTQGKWESDNRAMVFNPRKQNPFHESGAGININQNIEICIGGMQDEQGGAIGFLKNEDAECAAEAVNALSKLIFYAKHFLSIQKEIAVKNSG